MSEGYNRRGSASASGNNAAAGTLFPSRVHFAGDSYVEWNYNDSTGETGRDFRWASKLAGLIRAEGRNTALGGTSISNANSWTRTFYGFGHTRTAAPYLPAVEALLVHSGLNDINTTSNTSKSKPGIEGLRATVAMARSSAAFVPSTSFSATDGTMVFTGASWGAVNGLDLSSAFQGRARAVSTNGQSVTVNVPADHTGTVYLVFYAQNRGTANEGGTFDIAVDGGAAVTSAVDTRDKFYLNPALTPVVYKVTGLALGSTHTIIATAQNITSRAIFGFWTMEASECPQVWVIKQPYLTAAGYATLSGVASTDIDALNAGIDSIVSSFPSRVQSLDWTNAMQVADTTTYRTDGIHPAEKIQDSLASLAYTAMTGKTYPRQPVVIERGFNFKRQLKTWAPTGAVAENVPGLGATRGWVSQGGATPGTLSLCGGMMLEAGDIVSALTAWSNSAAVTGPTNQWACLVDQNLNVLAKTADNTTNTAWTVAFTKQTFTFSTPYVSPITQGVYVGFLVAGTTWSGLCGVTLVSALSSSELPALTGLSTTGLTNPASLGVTAAAITAKAGNYYALAT